MLSLLIILRNAGFIAILMVVSLSASMAGECRMTWSRDLSKLDFLPVIKSNLGNLVLINQERSIQLFRHTSESGTRPDLAESARFNTENNTLELKLRSGCGWSDGMPITSYDMKAGIEAVFSKDAVKQIAGRDSFKNGRAVYAGELPLSALGLQTPDEKTLYIPAAGSLELLQRVLTITQYTPVPLYKLASDPGYWSRPGMPEVASGPFYPTIVSPNKIIMKKNPHFCGTGPIEFDEIILFDNSSTSGPAYDLQLIKNEQLSVFGHSYNWRKDSGLRLSAINKNYREIMLQPSATDYLYLNLLRPALADPRTRKAIVLALDIEAFNSPQLSGHDSYIPDSIIPIPGVEGSFSHQTGSRPDRIKRAVQLLQEAGYSKEKPLLIKVLSRDSHVRIRSFTNAIASMLSPLPVQLDIDWYHNSKAFYDALKTRGKTDYDIYTSIWRQEIPDPSNFLVHLMDYATFTADTGAALIALIDKSFAEHNTYNRKDMFKNINKLMERDQSIIPLARHHGTLFVANDIKLLSHSWYAYTTRNFAPVSDCSGN